MEPGHDYYKTIVEDPRYANGPSKDEFPMFESLKLTIARTLPYWNDVIVPQMKAGKKILIAAHGNSLRGIVKHLDRELPCRLLIWFAGSLFIITFLSLFVEGVRNIGTHQQQKATWANQGCLNSAQF
ncbi:UNVERIFIED_CONTAM: hypothetical protein GTU68_008561 [Idotea baltica]|nr:hypothetical protein [Idotea baltica]